MSTLIGVDGWRWSVEPRAARVDADRLTWTCGGRTDLWRITEGVPTKHDAPALLLAVDADFRLEATFEAELADLYDQVGILAEVSEVRWLKAGVELDARLWLSAVHTHDASDWSREPLGELPVALAVERLADTVFCSVREHGGWRTFRVLHLPGPLAVGAYSCAPQGDGFEAVMRSASLTVS
jgi:regulation of enolase protein 1 (concanavalin A-like superfamily)